MIAISNSKKRGNSIEDDDKRTNDVIENVMKDFVVTVDRIIMNQILSD
jgi:hypothetical protein